MKVLARKCKRSRLQKNWLLANFACFLVLIVCYTPAARLASGQPSTSTTISTDDIGLDTSLGLQRDLVRVKNKELELAAHYEMSERQREIFLAGELINWFRARRN